jgi:hypothetical protein
MFHAACASKALSLVKAGAFELTIFTAKADTLRLKRAAERRAERSPPVQLQSLASEELPPVFDSLPAPSR